MQKMEIDWISSFCYFGLLILFSISFSVLALPSVSSTEEVVYQGNYFHGDEFFLNGVTYNLISSSSYDRLLIQGGGLNLWVNKGTCNSADNLRVCYESMQFDEAKNEYSMAVKISIIYPRLIVTQRSDESSLLLGDETEIEVTIENDGLLDAKSVVYRQRLPDGFSFVSDQSHGISYIGGYVIWESSNIRVDEERTFYYTILATGKNSDPLQSEVSFFNGFTTRNIFSNTVDVDVDSPYLLQLVSNSTEAKVGDEIKFNFMISNYADSSIDIESAKIFLPSAFTVVRKDNDLVQRSGYLEFAGLLREDETMDFEVVLRAINRGVVDILSVAKLSGVSFELDSDVRVNIEQPTTSYTLFFVRDGRDERTFQDLKENQILEGQQRGQIELFITNPYNSKIENVRAILNSEFINITSGLLTIDSKNPRRLIDNTFVTPSLESSRRDTLEINLTYITDFGYTHSEVIEKALTFEPVRDLEVRHTLSTSRPESGETLGIKVTARNTRRNDLYDVRIRDVLPEGISLRGSNVGTRDVSIGETETFFEYFIDLPVVSRDTDFEIFSEIEYSDGINTFERIVPYKFTIRPRNPDIQLRRTRDSQGPVRIGEFIDVSYEIRNREDYRVDNVVIEFPGVKGTYLVDSIEHRVQSLNPGQERNFERVERRVVFDYSSSLSVGRPNTIFTDDLGVRYHKEGPALSVGLQDDSFSLPKLHILKSVEGLDSKNFMYTIKVENVGDLLAEFKLHDSTETIHSLSPGDFIEINQTARFSDYPDLVLPRSYLSFSDGPYTYYALTDNIDIKRYIVEDEADKERDIIYDDITEEVDDTAESIVDEDSADDDVPQERVDENVDNGIESSSFFARIWNYFRGLLGLN